MISQTENMLYRLSNLDVEQQRLSYQMSTGKKLQNGSDDTNLYARQLYVDDKIRTYEGLKTQIDKTTAQNNVSDSMIGKIKEILAFVKTELLKASTITTTSEGLTAIAVNVEGMKENMLDLVNTQVEDEFLFSGSDSTIRPFEMDSDGKVTYNGDNGLRKIAVDEKSYRQRGLNGYELMFYPTSTAYKGETLTFSEDSKIFDQDGNEWRLNSPTNDTLIKYDYTGNATSETLSVTNDGSTPPVYSAVLPNIDGTQFVAKTNIFDTFNEVINSLNLQDKLGNPISESQARADISAGLENITKSYDTVNVAHAQLGGRNRVFEVSLERIESKLTQYNVLSQEIGAADLSKVAVEVKALELTYTALYSTINKTNQLSLVNFID